MCICHNCNNRYSRDLCMIIYNIEYIWIQYRKSPLRLLEFHDHSLTFEMYDLLFYSAKYIPYMKDYIQMKLYIFQN